VLEQVFKVKTRNRRVSFGGGDSGKDNVIIKAKKCDFY
jgi:hypothetical protein